MAKVFFSYSHADEAMRDRLEVHLSMLKRQGLIESWHDRRITAGSDVDESILQNLEEADVILLLVGADFIASEYCYSREMGRALQRHDEKLARVIPVILKPCDWHPAPFGKLLAAPRDGKPIVLWPNIDEAFTDVAKQIRSAVESLHSQKTVALPLQTSSGNGSFFQSPAAPVFAASQSQPAGRSSNLRLNKEFTDFDRDQFVHNTFEFIARFFESSLEELGARNPDIKVRFQRIDAERFSSVIYREGKSIAQCSIRLDSMGSRSQHIAFSYDASPARGSSNEMLHFESDSQSMYLTSLGMQPRSDGRDVHLSENGAAELLWNLLMEPLQR